MYEYLENLNKEQKLAATTIDGRVLILAGAGTGKTATLISRVAYMIDTGIDPESILLLTFTNKAAKEMRDRAAKMIGERANKITASTFHSFCAAFMRKYASVLDINNNFEIIDSVDSADAMSIVYNEFINENKDSYDYKKDKNFPTKGNVLKVYETAVNNCADIPSAATYLGFEKYTSQIEAIIQKFGEYKMSRNLLDYDDLLFFTKKILEENDGIRDDIDYQYKYIACDEYQDTNTIQNDILDLITYQEPNLCVVGDDNQSIYAFRCADIGNILSFSKRYPDCKTIILKENYRSTQEVLDLANTIMDYATEGIPKKLHGQTSGEKPFLVPMPNERAEAEFICKKIDDYFYYENIRYKDMAVIVRSARQSFTLENILSMNNIPFKKFGGLKFMEHAVVKDILAFLRVAVNDKDELAWFRILQLYPGIGKTFAKRIADAVLSKDINELDNLYKTRSFAEYLPEIKNAILQIRDLKLKDALEFLIEDYYPKTATRRINAQNVSENIKNDDLYNLKEEIEAAKALYNMSKNHRTINGFLSDIALDATQEEDNYDDYVNITTIHSAKGLEYDIVFLMDVIESVTPKCPEGDAEDPEELRCLYVAITRAKKKLYLFVPKESIIARTYDAQLSHFINKDDIIEAMNIYNNANISSFRKPKKKPDFWY